MGPEVEATISKHKRPKIKYKMLIFSSHAVSVSGDFSNKLDEVSEHYLKKGVCQGEECSQLRVQVS